ncbi:MAG: PIN domain-containing protein [Chloroflexota bacterium]|nr:PIN domain-containing protein [Chloroflexota bacterium]
MPAYLLDTNHAVQVMGGTDALRELLVRRGQPEDRFFISITVLSELYFAAYASRRQAQNLQSINRLLDHIPLLDLDVMAAEEYGRIRAELKAKGRPIPGTDVQIAAVARLHDLTVLSTDHHFQYVDNLRVENWL